MKVVAIIQARMSSERLPGKVLRELPAKSGLSVLEQVVRRLRRSKRIDEIAIATSRHQSDDAIWKKARYLKITCVRGDLNDVLSRYVLTAEKTGADVIVRITADCPCIDPVIVDKVISKFFEKRVNYASNCIQRTFSRGLDVEVFSREALYRADCEAKKKSDREHVTPYIYQTSSRKFTRFNVRADRGLNAPDIRITLDTIQDYMLLCVIYDLLSHKKYFSAGDIVRLIRKKPWLKSINQNVRQKAI